MKYLFIINDTPYGTEKAYNAFRLAMQIKKDFPENEIWIFLMADAATCALPNQNTPQGYYNIERMMKAVINKGGKVKICRSCAEARGIKDLQLIEGTELSNMSELANWTIQADKVLIF
jgi:uncharacterized protein involved in oxidation of intracellular sulfur